MTVLELNRALCDEPFCHDPDAVKLWSLERMKALWFGEAAMKRRRESRGESPPAVSFGEAAYKLHCKLGRERGYPQERIDADWRAKCERRRAEAMQRAAQRRKGKRP